MTRPSTQRKLCPAERQPQADKRSPKEPRRRARPGGRRANKLSTTPIRTSYESLVQKHGGISKAALALGVSLRTFERRLSEERRGKYSKRRTLKDWVCATNRYHSILQRVKTALATLGATWVTEIELCRLSNVATKDIGAIRTLLPAHVVMQRNGRYAWAGTTKLAAQMLRALNETKNAN